MRAEQPGGSIRFGDGAGVQKDTEMDYWALGNLSEELFNTLDRQRGNSMVGSLRKVRAHCPWRMPAGLQREPGARISGSPGRGKERYRE